MRGVRGLLARVGDGDQRALGGAGTLADPRRAQVGDRVVEVVRRLPELVAVMRPGMAGRLGRARIVVVGRALVQRVAVVVVPVGLVDDRAVAAHLEAVRAGAGARDDLLRRRVVAERDDRALGGVVVRCHDLTSPLWTQIVRNGWAALWSNSW